ncbi:neuroguidin-A [Cimex lectularius]|uniref:Neuroguidin n=1 Tax=Cimex lectularius TaxID=79782 RepID=A0A8I6RMW6_CIMLE|nr:neuroguidin-A [Cimex lectularius]
MITAENDVQEKDDEKEKAMLFFKEISDNAKTVTDLLQEILKKLKNGELNCNNGISLLDVKNQLLMFYLMNMLQVIIMKATGKSIVNSPAIEMLVELRVILEKIRPIEQKLKYQIDKLVKIAITGTLNENDPSQFKANPANMKTELEEESESEDDTEETKKKKSGVYVPPKLSAVYYDGDESRTSKREKIINRARKHALQSSVMQELKEEYLETPVEVRMTNSLKQKEDKYQKRKQEFEEEYMTRLPVTKQEKRRAKNISVLSTIGDEITRFEDTSILMGDESSISKRKKGLKRKMSQTKKGKKRRKT